MTHATRSSDLSFVYIIPVHNEEHSLAASVTRVLDHFEGRARHVRIVLGENGSRDRSAEVAAELVQKHPGAVTATSTASAGLGHGLACGLAAAFATTPPDANTFHVLTAADLPFGFTDLAAFERQFDASPTLRLAVGSKAHPRSHVRSSPVRGLATWTYALARRALLGMKTKDSQGSIFVRDTLARELLPRVRSRDFFFSTEFVYHAERGSVDIVELPVELQREVRGSTVRPMRDAWRMFRQLIELRTRRNTG